MFNQLTRRKPKTNQRADEKIKYSTRHVCDDLFLFFFFSHYIDVDKWWRRFGNHYPELQRLALKVLGLSCNGASSYELKREVAEKALSVKETHPSYEWLKEYSFVSYNLHLRELKNSGKKFNIEAHELDPCDDWIVGDY